MAASATDASEFKVSIVPSDEDGCRFYLKQYKPFRLTSLQEDAEAFGSTYTREINFSDEEWLARIKNPSAMTFVAVRSSDGRVVASTSLIGPLPNQNSASNPYQVISTTQHAHGHSRDGFATADDLDNGNNNGSQPLCFQMSAVYTSPEARGRGLAKSLIKAAADEARRKAVETGRPLALSVVVYATNDAAISVYERCGFVKSADGPKLIYNPLKKSSASELEMHFVGFH